MVEIRPLDIADYETLLQLFTQTQGITVRDADSLTSTDRYLQRNPGLSFVAVDQDRIVGCLLSGHDGRRGYLQHLVVSAPYRGQGIARRLVACCLEALARLGINKSHVEVLVTNTAAQAFWTHIGWHQREDILRYSFISSGGENA